MGYLWLGPPSQKLMRFVAFIAAATAALAVGTPAAASPVFVIKGYGFGHGIGLGQYGAAGLANNGSTYDQILAHYYRGTTLGTVDSARIRVLVSAPERAFVVASAVPFTLRGSGGNEVVLPGGSVTVSKKLVVTTGSEVHELATPLTFVPGEAPLSVGSRSYRGRINVHDTADGTLVVNDVPLEQYLYGVVPSEMPASWAVEALKAQAVAARSYALATRRTSGVFDAYSDTRSQVYGGLAVEQPRTSDAVDATSGQVVLHEGVVATTFFFSTSGGRTAAIEDVWRGASALPYLRSVEDPADAHSPYHRWGPIVLSRKQLQRQLRTQGPRGITDVTTTTNASGRVDLFVMLGSRRQVAIDGAAARTALGLRSTGFAVGVLDLFKPQAAAKFRQKVAIQGIARNVRSVTLELKTDGRWAHFRDVTPDAAGNVRVRVRPTRTSIFRLVSAAIRGSGVRAPRIKVLVGARATLERKRRGVFVGAMRPKQAGAPVRLERLGKRGWRRVARSTTSATGKYRFRLRPRPAGEYRAVVTPHGGELVPGTSKIVSIG